MTWVAVGAAGIGAVGSIAGGLFGASGAAKAGQSAAQAALINQQTAYNLYGQTKATLDPFVQAGTSAVNQIKGLNDGTLNISDQLNANPLFKWQSQELQRFNERKLAKQGLTNSGAGLELNSRGYQALLGNNAQQYFNNLMGTAQLGENAGAMTGNAAANASNSITQSNTLAGQQAGNAQIQQGVAYGNIGTGIANAAISGIGLYQNQLNAQTYQNMFQQMMQNNIPATTSFSGGGSNFRVNTPGALGTTF